MKPKISKRVDLLSESPTRKIDSIKEELVRSGRDIYLLSTGQPSILPPSIIRRYLANLLVEDYAKLYGYTPSNGFLELREAISEDLKNLGKVDVDPKTQILVTAGGQAAIFVSLSTIVEEGDEVIIFDPTFFEYKPIIEYLGGRVKTLPTRVEDRFQPDIELLKEMVTDKVKAVIVVSPDNPTGRIIDESVGKAISELAVDHNLWILYDEAYRTITYEGDHLYLYNLAPENVVCINAFSKDPGIPGWRLGFIYGPREFVEKAKLVNEGVTYCPPSFAQIAATYYLKSDVRRSFIREVVEDYRERRDALVEALKRELPKSRFLIPQGGMFIFVNFREYLSRLGLDSETFSERLLNEKLVATIPGGYFGSNSRDYLRLSFVGEDVGRLKKAVRLIREFVEDNLTV